MCAGHDGQKNTSDCMSAGSWACMVAVATRLERCNNAHAHKKQGSQQRGACGGCSCMHPAEHASRSIAPLRACCVRVARALAMHKLNARCISAQPLGPMALTCNTTKGAIGNQCTRQLCMGKCTEIVREHACAADKHVRYVMMLIAQLVCRPRPCSASRPLRPADSCMMLLIHS